MRGYFLLHVALMHIKLLVIAADWTQKIPPIGHFDPDTVLGCPGLQYTGPDVSVRCFRFS